MPNVEIVTANYSHIEKISEIHYNSLPDDYLPSLGLVFLKELYYPSIIDSELGITYAAVYKNKVVGFVTVAIDSNNFIGNIIKKNILKYIKNLLIATIRKPKIILKHFQIMYSVFFTKKDEKKLGEIFFLAVDEEYRKRGVAKLLIEKAQSFLISNNVKGCKIKTLLNNTNVIRVYEKMGWIKSEKYSLIGNDYVLLEKEFK